MRSPPGLTLLLPALLLTLLPATQTGCTWAARFGTDRRGEEHGKVFYIGGAGGLGQVIGVLDVPGGLRDARYRGGIETFAWQSVIGGTIRDQADRGRNIEQAERLAGRICDYLDDFPGRPVDIIALSAGTGIATWALESLPEGYRVRNVAFLASSLSRGYDLTEALRHIDGRLYAFSSTNDSVLRYMMPLAGSVDREYASAAGLFGFAVPRGADEETRRLYNQKLRHRPYRRSWERYGYDGGHTTATARQFIRRVVAPLLMKEPEGEPRAEQIGGPAETPLLAEKSLPADKTPPAGKPLNAPPAAPPATPPPVPAPTGQRRGG